MHSGTLESHGHSHVFLSHLPRAPRFYKAKLASLSALSHVTVEVERCDGAQPNLC